MLLESDKDSSKKTIFPPAIEVVAKWNIPTRLL